MYDFIPRDYLGVDAAKLTLQLRRYMAGHPVPETLEKTYHGLAQGHSIKVPNIPWELRLESPGNEAAEFSLVRAGN